MYLLIFQILFFSYESLKAKCCQFFFFMYLLFCTYLYWYMHIIWIWGAKVCLYHLSMESGKQVQIHNFWSRDLARYGADDCPHWGQTFSGYDCYHWVMILVIIVNISAVSWASTLIISCTDCHYFSASYCYGFVNFAFLFSGERRRTTVFAVQVGNVLSGRAQPKGLYTVLLFWNHNSLWKLQLQMVSGESICHWFDHSVTSQSASQIKSVNCCGIN